MSAAHLAGEDRERKVPRRDADKHALAVQLKLVVLGGRARQHRGVRDQEARLLRVVTQEVDRLAYFGDGVGNRLARLADQQVHELGHARFEPGGGALERCRTTRDGRGVPARLRLPGRIDDRIDRVGEATAPIRRACGGGRWGR